jgi:hypothetical protein
MPFHPLGIAVLGTLAVVSTGVAFKKVRFPLSLLPSRQGIFWPLIPLPAFSLRRICTDMV